MQSKFLTGLLLALVLFLAVPAIAQDTGIISGRVQDPSGAVVSGAQVSIVNLVLSHTKLEQEMPLAEMQLCEDSVLLEAERMQGCVGIGPLFLQIRP